MKATSRFCRDRFLNVKMAVIARNRKIERLHFHNPGRNRMRKISVALIMKNGIIATILNWSGVATYLCAVT